MGIKQLVLLVIFALGSSCSGNTNEIKLKQYIAEGQKLYAQNCTNCHQEDGRGLGTLYPPLAQSDYISADTKRTICLIRYGVEGPMVVNGMQYDMEMPDNPRLTALEIAEIATFITNSWGENKGLLSVNEVEKILADCE